MMMSPQSFVNQHADKPYRELLLVRDELLEDIRAFETEPYDAKKDLLNPPKAFVYIINLEYLEKLLELIAEKYSQEYKSFGGRDDIDF